MAIITPGTDGTLKSATAEGQLQELVSYLQIQQADPLKNPQELSYVSGEHSQASRTFSTSFTIPLTQTLSDQGTVIYSANEYLANVNFQPGSNGTFKNPTTLGYFLEIIIFLQNLEADVTRNPQNLNNVTANISSDSRSMAGNANLPVDLSIGADGSVIYTVKPYLL